MTALQLTRCKLPDPVSVSLAPPRQRLLHRKCSCGGTVGPTGECESCRKKRLALEQKTRNSEGDATNRSAVPQVVHEVLRSRGEPLDSTTRAFMEPRFGHDFSKVRVHADEKAADSAEAVNARAYTVGADVVFGRGRFAPRSSEGQALIAHELTHVVQQKFSKANPDLTVSADAAQENEANAVQYSFHSHKHAPSVAPVSGRPRLAKQGLSQPTPSQPSKKDAPQVCESPKGPGKHPDSVGQTLIDRLMGKHEKEGDHGELCVEHPYVAGPTEHVCTIGYGHQIPDCPVLSKATGQKPTAEELSKAKISDLKCACEGRKFDCKGTEGETQLRRDAGGAAAYVRKTVPVDLSQDQFDALVDITLAVGHIPSELLDAIKKYWCTVAGKDYVRDIYLKTALTRPKKKEIEPGFVNRRKFRVWAAKSAE